RETIIYIDGTAIKRPEQAPELALTISQKIGLAPRERVLIFFVRAAEGAKEIFNKCWPDLTSEELEHSHAAPDSWFEWIKKAFDETPEQKLKDTQDFFRLNVQNAIENERVVGSAAPTDFVRLLSGDKNRLSFGGKIYRVLIFSPMTSELVRGTSTTGTGDESDRVDVLFREYPMALQQAYNIISSIIH